MKYIRLDILRSRSLVLIRQAVVSGILIAWEIKQSSKLFAKNRFRRYRCIYAKSSTKNKSEMVIRFLAKFGRFEVLVPQGVMFAVSY